jgi:hypothetical protein
MASSLPTRHSETIKTTHTTRFVLPFCLLKQTKHLTMSASVRDIYILSASITILAVMTAVGFANVNAKFVMLEARKEAFDQGVQAERARRLQPPPFDSQR